MINNKFRHGGILILFLALLLSNCYQGAILTRDNELSRAVKQHIDQLREADGQTAVSWHQDAVYRALAQDYVKISINIQDNYPDEVSYAKLIADSKLAITNAWNDGERDAAKLLEQGMYGVFANLDSFSRYLNAHEYKALEQLTDNKFAGIGIMIQKHDRGLEIMKIYPESDLAGSVIKVGDIITHADTTDLSELNLGQAISLLRGEQGSKVTLTFLQVADERNINLEVTRSIIKLTVLTSEQIPFGDSGEVLLIKINNFNVSSSKDFDKVLSAEFTDFTDDIPQGLIVDLRNNGGGLLAEVIPMVDKLLPSGTILSVVYRDDVEKFTAYRSDLIPKDTPVVILINKASASAAEIFAGTLQAAHRATIIGQESFGKTSVQQVFRLSRGTGYKLTVAKYQVYGDVELEPNVKPDIFAVDDSETTDDEIIEEAVKYLQRLSASG